MSVTPSEPVLHLRAPTPSTMPAHTTEALTTTVEAQTIHVRPARVHATRHREATSQTKGPQARVKERVRTLPLRVYEIPMKRETARQRRLEYWQRKESDDSEGRGRSCGVNTEANTTVADGLIMRRLHMPFEIQTYGGSQWVQRAIEQLEGRREAVELTLQKLDERIEEETKGIKDHVEEIEAMKKEIEEDRKEIRDMRKEIDDMFKALRKDLASLQL
ncbi:hypothetical protein BDN70DRAFT_886641 [Pholiota conissans]|uniref:Uncharacterized protein n=1 Tax=Pholiota conissans TaxID=109636 RepID=A0A9P6CMV4_9AGAR|nr:hypothetical protein BDN70DRAFT_886641 [Pholiota conissans]